MKRYLTLPNLMVVALLAAILAMFSTMPPAKAQEATPEPPGCPQHFVIGYPCQIQVAVCVNMKSVNAFVKYVVLDEKKKAKEADRAVFRKLIKANACYTAAGLFTPARNVQTLYMPSSSTVYIVEAQLRPCVKLQEDGGCELNTKTITVYMFTPLAAQENPS